MTNFYKRMKVFGFGRIMKSYDFIIPLIIAVIGYFTFFDNLYSEVIRISLLSDIILASIMITTIILAGFAIMISLTERGLIKYLKKYGIYDNVIFTFEYTTVLSITTLIITILNKYLVSNKNLFYFNLFLFIYLLACLIQLVFFINDYAIKKGELYS